MGQPPGPPAEVVGCIRRAGLHPQSHGESQSRQSRIFHAVEQWPFEWADFQLRQMQIGSLGAAETIDDTQPEPTDPSYSARAFARQNELLTQLRRFNIPV